MKKTEEQKWCDGSEGQGYVDPDLPGTPTMLLLAASDAGEDQVLLPGHRAESEAFQQGQRGGSGAQITYR